LPPQRRQHRDEILPFCLVLACLGELLLVAEAEGRDPTVAADQIVAGLTPAEIAQWSDGTLEIWARESYDLAKTAAYRYPTDIVAAKRAAAARKGGTDSCAAVPVYRIDAAYQERAITALRQQLAKSGVRRAFLIRLNVR
jgi:hypothetical protein